MFNDLFSNAFRRSKEFEELETKASRVGITPTEAMRGGIEMAKLGLTVDDLARMARTYFILQRIDMKDRSQEYAVTNLLRAIREANEC